MELSTDDTILRKLSALVQKFRDDPYMELEVRLGIRDEGIFVPDVSFEYFKALYTSMVNKESIDIWDTEPTKSDFTYMTYKMPTCNVRGTYKINQPTEYFEVSKVGTPIDIKCPTRPFCLRFSGKREVPLANFSTYEKAEVVRINTRCSIVHEKVWRYDFSKVGVGRTTEEATKNNKSIHIELELKRDEEYLSKYDNRVIAINFLGRARDLLGRFNDREKEEKLELLLV